MEDVTNSQKDWDDFWYNSTPIPFDTMNSTVNKYTRASKDGKDIVCPLCNNSSRVYHFGWSSLQCLYCETMINKNEWRIA